MPRNAVAGMINAIHGQTGTPQNPVDWTDPDAWIGERLSGGAAELARRIWEESGRTVTPRHVNGSYLFVNSYRLLVTDAEGVYRLTERGQAFLEGSPEVVREIDEAEGLPQLLAILATKARAKRADLLPEWGEFLREHSKFGTPSTIRDTLRHRLVKLVERGMVSREGNAYVITPEGVEYTSAPSGQGNGDRARGGRDKRPQLGPARGAARPSWRDAPLRLRTASARTPRGDGLRGRRCGQAERRRGDGLRSQGAVRHHHHRGRAGQVH